MGFSEWGFPIRSPQELEQVLKLVEEHNKAPDNEVGEELHAHAIIRYKLGRKWSYFLCVGNEGGRDLTSSFISSNYGGPVYYPFAKPEWWSGCNDYVWKRTDEDTIPRYPGV